MMDECTYREVTAEEVEGLPKDATKCRHCAHAMIYAKLPEKMFGRYDKLYAITMQMRFDGTLGFAGGMVDEGEKPEDACSRECYEELGLSPDNFVITPDDHIVTHYSDKTHFCLHFYAKEVSLELLLKMERNITTCHDWGEEVLGYVRCPLYTLPNGMGFPAFLQNQYIGNARSQLITGILKCGLLSEAQVKEALIRSNTVDCVVTNDNTDY